MAFSAGWEYSGTLAEAGNTDSGSLWEYPVLAKLPQAKAAEDGKILFEYNDQEVGVSSTAERDHVLLTGWWLPTINQLVISKVHDGQGTTQ